MKIYPVEGADWKLDQGEPAFPNNPRHPLWRALVEVIDSWPEDDPDRRALEMWAWERLTFRQIAEEFGLADRPSGYYRVQRALARLKKETTSEDS